MNDRLLNMLSNDVESWQLSRQDKCIQDVAVGQLPTFWARIRAGERTLGLLASARAPAGVLLAIHDLAKAWRRHGPIIVSGFHAPAENEALAVLLHGPQPAVLVLARALYRRPPPALRPAPCAGRRPPARHFSFHGGSAPCSDAHGDSPQPPGRVSGR